MNLYLMPIQNVLLEYVLKLGNVVFFPGSINEEDISKSKLSDDEKTRLKRIIGNNKVFNMCNGTSYIMIESIYNTEDISKDILIANRIFEEAERALDYVKILECPFQRPEYFIGIPGLERNKRYLMEIDEDFNLGFVIEGNNQLSCIRQRTGDD